jgi:protein TonB
MTEHGPISVLAEWMEADRVWPRLPLLVPLALLLWTLVLVAFAHILGERLEAPTPTPIEVGLLVGGGSLSAGALGPGAPALSATPAAVSPASKPEAIAAPKRRETEKVREEVKPSTPPTPAAPTPAARETPAKALAKPKPEPAIKPVHHAVARAKKVKPPPSPPHRVAKASAAPAPIKANTPAKTNAPAAAAGLAAKAGPSGAVPNGGAPGARGQAAGPGGSLGSANGGAQAIYAPVPTIPDDLRADVFHAEAIARFQVLPDGTAQVTLVRPTPNPRLNYLLLETLKQWRFFPAVREGKAVASVVEIRIPIAIE